MLTFEQVSKNSLQHYCEKQKKSVSTMIGYTLWYNNYLGYNNTIEWALKWVTYIHVYTYFNFVNTVKNVLNNASSPCLAILHARMCIAYTYLFLQSHENLNYYKFSNNSHPYSNTYSCFWLHGKVTIIILYIIISGRV